MHDLDRTMQELEFDQEYDEFEYGDQMEYDNEYDGEYDNEYDEAEYDSEYADETDDYEADYEYDGEYDFETGSPFSEEEEMELAAELLNVSSDAELDQFLGRFARRMKRRLRRFGRGLKKVGRGSLKVIRAVAKKALPIAGGVVGGMFGGPMGAKLGGMAGKGAGNLFEQEMDELGFEDQEWRDFARQAGKKGLVYGGKTVGRKAGGSRGSRVGGHLANAASSLFELELEGMSPEDQEFEVARRMVRFAGAATKNAAQLGQKMPANKAIKSGFKSAAKKHAPGLLKPNAMRKSGTGMKPSRIVRSGRWIMRDDNRIVILGL